MRCLSQFGVYPGNTTDTDRKLRFNSHNPAHLFNENPLVVRSYYAKWNDLEFGNLEVRSRGNQ